MTYWLNALLNRVSMYRLLSIALSTMAIVAFLLSVAGLLPQQPLAMLVSASLLILISYSSNLLFSRLFAVKAHQESSYITALILFFLFSPSLHYVQLAELALVAMIASASKYIIAVRGRHIFNPAAIAAVIVSLLGIAYASWWVATPVLLPITLLSAGLILYKTRRLTMASLFLVVAIGAILIDAAVSGQTISAAISLLPSWPLIFFAGIMLSEPLTLPPRRWQQYLEAVVVGLLFAIPIHIGTLSSTPAVALIVGNLIAFSFLQRRSILLMYKGSEQLTPRSREYRFKSVRPLHFLPGQYMEITVPHTPKDGRGIRRSFSIVAAPGATDIAFGVRIYDKSSSFKTALKALHKGTIIHATTVGGDFILPERSDIPLLFIAGGIGITPFISHLLYLQQQAEVRDIVLVYSVNAMVDIAYVEILKRANIRVIIVTQSGDRLPVTSWQHINQQYLSSELLSDLLPDITARRVYVSGPPTIVDSTKHIMQELGVRGVTSDYFTGY